MQFIFFHFYFFLIFFFAELLDAELPAGKDVRVLKERALCLAARHGHTGAVCVLVWVWVWVCVCARVVADVCV